MSSPSPRTRSSKSGASSLMGDADVRPVSAAKARLAHLRAGDVTGMPADFSGVSLIGEDLSGLDLSCANFAGADLSRADLRETNLFGAQLTGTILFEANLAGAELSGANLERANLEGANLKGAGLGHADLTDASLVRATLADATLTEANLTRADLRSANLRDARARHTVFSDADLTKVSCRGTEFDRSELAGAVLDHADLRGSSLSGVSGYGKASWIGVDMRDIDFTGAYLCRRHIMDQNFIEEFRRQSRGTQVAYHVWRITSDCGRSVVRWSACTGLIVLVFAWLYTIVGVDFGAYETPLSPLYFSVVTMTTLGFGDVLPSTMPGQIVAMCEVVAGYVMLGGLLSLFTSKMASRAD